MGHMSSNLSSAVCGVKHYCSRLEKWYGMSASHNAVQCCPLVQAVDGTVAASAHDKVGWLIGV